MSVNIRCCATTLLVVLVCASGCRTRQPVEPSTGEKVPAGAPVVFRPAASQVPINMESGRYPTLFGGGTRATWIEAGSMSASAAPLAAEMKAPATGVAPKASVDAMDQEDSAIMAGAIVVNSSSKMTDTAGDELRMLSAGFNVIVVDVESAFTDTAMAYDLVGFRGIQAYLRLPNGQQIQPVQIMVGSDLTQEPQGALRKYRRKNVLLFPKDPIPVSAPLAGTQAPGVRLVLEGHASVFYFEWPAQVPTMIGPPKFSERESVKKIGEGYDKAREKERGILHKFD